MKKEEQKIIQLCNWNSIKHKLSYYFYFKPIYDDRKLVKNIDSKELLENLLAFNKAHEELHLPIISSDYNDWLPDFFWEVDRWISASNFFWAEFNSLGVDCVKYERRDLLKVLAKVGDKKAIVKKVRTKLPEELIGKKLRFQKIDSNKWEITLEEPKFEDKFSKYDELYYSFEDVAGIV